MKYLLTCMAALLGAASAFAAKPLETAENALGVQNSLGAVAAVTVWYEDGRREFFAPTAATDAGRGDAMENAIADALATTGREVIVGFPGKFYIDKATSTISSIVSQFALEDGMTIMLNGAELYKKSTDTASCMFTASAATGIGDISIIGPGILTGSRAATANTAARGTALAEIGLNFTANRRVKLHGVVVRNMAGVAVQGNTSNFPTDDYGGSSAKYSTIQISDCSLDLNYIGLLTVAGNEYWQVANSTFNKNQTGMDIYGGNLAVTNSQASGNTSYALRIRNTGGNNGHGSWTGGHITHNSDFAIHVEASMPHGFLFSGVTFGADSATTNKIQSLGGGITLSGCYVQSPFYASATPSGMNAMIGCFIAGSGGTDYTTITDLSGPELAQWRFKENYTLTGAWANNN